jgi:RNA polymerase sigma-70 factor, ECF subfamily
MSEQPSLLSSFFAKLPDSLGQALAAGTDLEHTLQTLFDSARSTWPSIPLAPHEFIAFLAEQLPGDAATLDDLRDLRLPDLYLVCACIQKIPEALRAFESEVLAKADAALGSILKSPELIADLKQNLMKKFFVEDGESRPLIQRYSGQRSLQNWVFLITIRKALSLQKRVKREESLHQRVLDAERALEEDPELKYLRQLYQKEFGSAFSEALAALSAKERNLLRYHILEELNIDQIGFIFKIHRATAARWIDKVRRKLLEKTRLHLLQGLHLGTSEYESLMRLIQSQLHLSLRQYLGEEKE